jgi:23S rRNA G2069 N7-methylase RlmK/C1962 C5-methylase RlmI
MSAPDLPDAGFIYTGPMYWPHKTSWKPDPTRCRASVADGGRSPSFHQCNRKAKVERDVLHNGQRLRLAYCNTHDPVAVAVKRAAQEAQWRAKWDERDRRQAEQKRREKLAEAAINAIRQIAAGHNDARGLAQEVLARFGEGDA